MRASLRASRSAHHSTHGFKRPYIVIHRVDLHRILLDGCEAQPNVELMPLTSATRYEDLGDRVRLYTENNWLIEGAAIVGADGLRSTIRQQIVKEGEPRMIGFVAHRTIVPMSEGAGGCATQ